MDRRRFLQIIGAAGVVAAIPWRFDWQRGLHWAQAQAFVISPALPLWGTGLRGVGPGVIPVAAADRAGPGYRRSPLHHRHRRVHRSYRRRRPHPVVGL